MPDPPYDYEPETGEHQQEPIKSELEELDAQFAGKFEQLESDAKRILAGERAREKSERIAARPSAADSRGLSYGMSIVVAIAGFPFVGLGLGKLIDQVSEPKIWSGILMVVFATIGVWYAFRIIARANKDL